MRSRGVLTGLVLLAAAARLTLQVLAMPAYAGLDEIFHVARISFVSRTGRNPTSAELSVPVYLIASSEALPGAPPDFALHGREWTRLSRAAPFSDPPLASVSIRDVLANYEAQQPSLYYDAMALLSRILRPRTQLHELMLIRFASVFFALVAAAGTAFIGQQLYGRLGLLAASLVCTAPAWLTLVARAGNDALACGLLAIALTLSLRREERPAFWAAEALAWAGAVATKLTVWPVLAALPAIWICRRPRQPRRMALVLGLSVVSVLIVAVDLHHRTGIAVGTQGFANDPTASPSAPEPVSYGAWFRVFLASAIWPGGQHGNALTRLGLILFAAPLLFFAAPAFLAALRSARFRRIQMVTLTALCSFAFAQLVNAVGFIRKARRAGLAMPAGGNEGWYVYTLAPLVFGVLIGGLFFARRRQRFLLAGVVFWLLAWDVTIHEGGLFRDYAGFTSPSEGGVFFRWGEAPRAGGAFLERLSAVSPLHIVPTVFILLRLVHLGATLALLALVTGRRQNRQASGSPTTDTPPTPSPSIRS